MTPDQFNAAMQAAGCFEAQPHLAIAVSGGADSMALLLMAHDWARTHGGRVTALTVDHGLRPEAAQEAQQVKAWCEARTIPHHTLAWRPTALATAIQEKARAARYGLLREWCEKNNAPCLLTAHHRDDQAETLFFRLGRGSGLDGLACMAPVTALGGVKLVRPLLAFPKSQLVAFMREKNQTWIEDPSNQNNSYTRIRIRKALASCEDPEGMSKRAYAVTRSLAKFRAAMEEKLDQKLSLHVTFTSDGAVMDADGFMALEPEYSLRMLAHIVQRLGEHEHKPRTQKLERLKSEITGGKINHPRELGGCVFHPPIDGKMRISRIAQA